MYKNYEMNVKLMEDYKSGDPVKKAKATEALFYSVEPFIHQVLKAYKKFITPNNYEDFLQTAYIAVISSLKDYNPEHSLTTWVPIAIKHELQKYISNMRGMTNHYSQRINHITNTIEKLNALGIAEPTALDIATVLGITEKQVIEALQIKESSLMVNFENDDMCAELGIHAESPEEIYERQETDRILIEALNKLDEIKRGCLLHTYGACGFCKLKQQEIANKYSISLFGVKTERARALREVRKYMNTESRKKGIGKGQKILNNKDLPVFNNTDIDIYVTNCDRQILNELGDTFEDLELK